MAAGSLRAQLLQLMLPPLAGLLALGALLAYLPPRGPAAAAYDEALTEIAHVLGTHVHVQGKGYRLDLPSAVERVLRADRSDKIYFRVRDPSGRALGGDEGVPGPPAWLAGGSDPVAYDAMFGGDPVRVVSVPIACGSVRCTVEVAETTRKRERLLHDVLYTSLLPELLIALATLAIVGIGIKRGLAPLSRLSEEIRARAPWDLRAVDGSAAPEEARPLVAALNDLLARADDARRNQQRFVANAAHQLRTPLAGLQAHAEVVLARPLPEALRPDLEFIRETTSRTVRLANQLLALARAEPGGRAEAPTAVDLKRVVEEIADDWVQRALVRDIDLGLELDSAVMRGDPMLLREAIGNLIHNAMEYAPPGGRVTVRSGLRAGRPCVEVEDDGPGIAAAERARVVERFYRVPGTPGTGSGLGLAIVQEVAAAHGAVLEIVDGQANAAGGRGTLVRMVFGPLELEG